MTYVTEAEMSKLGLSLVAGKMPTADNEYAISKHIVDAFKSINSTANITYETMLTTYKNFRFGYQDGMGTIVGIVDDGSDYSEYMNMDSSQISSDYMLQQKISRELDFGFGNMLYITETKYNELLAEPINMQLNIVQDNSSSSFNLQELTTLQDAYNEYFSSEAENWISNRDFGYKNGEIFQNNTFANLNNNEILIHRNSFDALFETSSDDTRRTALNSTTPLTMDICVYNYETYQYDTVVKTYTVVGYFTSESESTIFANTTTATEINGLKAQYNGPFAMVKDGSVASSGYSDYAGLTVEEKFFIDYPWMTTKEEYAEQNVE